MKVKTNWLSHQYYGERENGGFEKKGADERKKLKHSDFYIIKKEKKASEEFSLLLINEFNGTKISSGRDKSGNSYLPNFDKYELNQSRKPLVDKDLAAVNFLNGYWA